MKQLTLICILHQNAIFIMQKTTSCRICRPPDHLYRPALRPWTPLGDHRQTSCMWSPKIR